MNRGQYDSLLVELNVKIKELNDNVSFARGVFEHMKAIKSRMEHFEKFVEELTEAYENAQDSLSLHNFFVREYGNMAIIRDLNERRSRDEAFLKELQSLIALATS